MRNLIIGISLCFFSLSAFIAFRASEIDVDFTYNQPDRQTPELKDLPAKSENDQRDIAQEQSANRALVEELQARINQLEDRLLSTDEEMEARLEAERAKKRTRTLAVLGAGAFRSGQVSVNEDLLQSVQALVPDITASPGYRVMIEGHTDNLPISATAGKRYRDNMELSFLRARAVATILVQSGISRDRISVVGYGDTRPISSNDTPEGRVRNRRVEVKLVPAGKEF